MNSRRIHIMGASGSGVTTLGRALADALAIPHHDTDDYFHQPTNPPYTARREIPERLRLMREVFVPRASWILSGSLLNWGDPLCPLFDAVIYVTAPADVRVARLQNRQARQFGADAIAPGGWHHRDHTDFLVWAAQYDKGTRDGRSQARHEAWLATLQCPVLRVDGAMAIAALVAQTSAWIESTLVGPAMAARPQ
jgi:adenylate kinase family enzyme